MPNPPHPNPLPEREGTGGFRLSRLSPVIWRFSPVGEGIHDRRFHRVAGGYDPRIYGLALPHVFVYPRSRSQRHVDVSMRVHPAPMSR
jgi:hypothetical protein